jgi:DNA-binding beta-propeller fold protein YncE
LNRAIGKVAVVALLATTWASCGGGNSNNNTQTKPLSHIQNRLFVSNAQNGTVQVVDASNDKIALSTFNIFINGAPTFMDSTPDATKIAVYDASFTSIAVISSLTEDRVNKVALDAASDSMRITSDGLFVYAAVRNRLNTAPAPNGAVQQVDVTNAVIKASIPVPNARYLAMDHANKTILAFDDNSNTPYLIDLTATTPAAVPLVGPFSRPIAAYFTTDDTKAYVLSCGPECGGTQAQVTELTLATGATRTVAVPAASVGLLNGTTLYVAGAPGGNGGVLSAVDTAAMTVSGSVNIGPGFHQVMRLAANKVWIGARNCGGAGCLSVFDPSSAHVVVDNPVPPAVSKGDVTGMDFDTPNNQMYVCEGGELLRYDANANEVPTLVDIVGNAFDVRAVPPVK